MSFENYEKIGIRIKNGCLSSLRIPCKHPFIPLEIAKAKRLVALVEGLEVANSSSGTKVALLEVVCWHPMKGNVTDTHTHTHGTKQ
jgi:hypothetical protein